MTPNTQVTTRQSMAVATVDSARKFLESPGVQDQLKLACKKHVTPDRMARLVLTAVQKSPKLVECFATDAGKRSVGLAMLTAGQYGLEPDGRGCHFVPFRDNKNNATICTFVAGYQGLIGLAYNHPAVKAVWADAVYQNEKFIYRKGMNLVLEHEPLMDDEDPGDLRAAYAVAELRDGGKVVVVLFKRDIERIKASSRGASQDSSPWNTHPGEMWKKSALRQLCKIIPQSSELREVLVKEDDFEERGMQTINVTSTEPEVRFQKQVTQVQPEQTVPSGSVGDGGQEQAAPEPQPEPSPEQPETSPTEKPAAKKPEPKEESEAEKIAQFYRAQANAGFDDLKKTMLRLQPGWKETLVATDYAGLTPDQAKAIWSGRHGIAREVKKDLNAK